MTPDDNGISATLTVERIARVLVSWRSSANAEGALSSGAGEVDQHWPEEIDEAVALLKAIREPDAEMAAIGDVAIWRRMIEAAIHARAKVILPVSTPVVPEVRDAGREAQSHDGAWTRRDERLDESFPASDPAPINPGVD